MEIDTTAVLLSLNVRIIAWMKLGWSDTNLSTNLTNRLQTFSYIKLYILLKYKICKCETFDYISITDNNHLKSLTISILL